MSVAPCDVISLSATKVQTTLLLIKRHVIFIYDVQVTFHYCFSPHSTIKHFTEFSKLFTCILVISADNFLLRLLYNV